MYKLLLEFKKESMPFVVISVIIVLRIKSIKNVCSTKLKKSTWVDLNCTVTSAEHRHISSWKRWYQPFLLILFVCLFVLELRVLKMGALHYWSSLVRADLDYTVTSCIYIGTSSYFFPEKRWYRSFCKDNKMRLFTLLYNFASDIFSIF